MPLGAFSAPVVEPVVTRPVGRELILALNGIAACTKFFRRDFDILIPLFHTGTTGRSQAVWIERILTES